MSEKTKNIITKIVIPVVLTAAVIVVAIWGSAQSARAESYRTTTESMYTRAFNELGNDLSEMETTLSKLLIVTSPQQYVLLLDDVWRLSGSAVSLMSQIPSYHLDTVELNRFIVRVGDYAHSLTKRAIRNNPMTDEDRKTLNELHTACASISEEINGRISALDIPTAVITADMYYMQNEEAAIDPSSDTQTQNVSDTSVNEIAQEDTQAGAAQSAQEGAEESGQEGDAKAEEDVPGFPTLIYDGPFSESAEKLEAKGLTGDEIDEQTALERACIYSGYSIGSFSGAVEGRIPAYDFSFLIEDGREFYVSVSRQGGQLVYMMGSATQDFEGIPDESITQNCETVSKQWLDSMGYADMTATYAQYYGGAALINYAATQQGAILYNDLVKVWVDIATYEVIGVDARNYLFSHTTRDISAPAISVEEAEQNVFNELEIGSRALALIPVTPETEVLCWEFKGSYANNDYIVYINARTGVEEQIFRIINTENGVLVL